MLFREPSALGSNGVRRLTKLAIAANVLVNRHRGQTREAQDDETDA